MCTGLENLIFKFNISDFNIITKMCPIMNDTFFHGFIGQGIFNKALIKKIPCLSLCIGNQNVLYYNIILIFCWTFWTEKYLAGPLGQLKMSSICIILDY